MGRAAPDSHPHPESMKPAMSPTELAKHIGRSYATVLRWAKADLIPCTRRNARVIVFDPNLVEEAMAKNNLKGRKIKGVNC